MSTLDDLAHLYERATAGPWEDAGTSGAIVSNNEDAVDDFKRRCASPSAVAPSIAFYNGVPVFESCQRADRDLILAMHAALPQLLTAVALAEEIIHMLDGAGMKHLAREYRRRLEGSPA